MMSNSMNGFMASSRPHAPSRCATHYWRERREMRRALHNRDSAAIRTFRGSPGELRDRYNVRGIFTVAVTLMKAPADSGRLRIATWNMAYWSHRGMLEDAWQCYLDTVDADFYLFQEGRPSAVYNQHVVWNEIGGTRPWGSGVYSPTHEVLEESIKTDFKGSLTIANANVRGTALTLISMYGLMEGPGPTKGYAIPNLHRMLSDLTGLFNGHIGRRRDIILGGDLNASTQLDPQQGNRSHELFFARLLDFGLEDTHSLAGHNEHLQTLRHHKSDAPWQNDYLLVSKRLAGRFRDYQIIDTHDVRRFSDHNIVVIDIKL